MLKPNRIRLDARYGDATDAGIAIEVAGSGEKPVLLSPDIVPTG